MLGRSSTRTVYKYQLQIEDLQEISVPAGAQFLSVQYQRGVLTLWVLVNPENAHANVMIEIIGTGNPADDYPRTYIGTAQSPVSCAVWHVFWRYWENHL